MTENEKKPEEKKQPSSNPLLEEVKAEREKLEKVRDEAKAQADRLEQLRSDQLLSGTAGINTPAPEPKVETAKEYADRIMNNKSAPTIKE